MFFLYFIHAALAKFAIINNLKNLKYKNINIFYTTLDCVILKNKDCKQYELLQLFLPYTLFQISLKILLIVSDLVPKNYMQ